jgi:hypothetical protein
MGRVRGAFEEFEKGLPDLDGISDLKTAFEASALGDENGAQEKVGSAIQELERQGTPAGYLAVISTAAGRNEEAFFWLEQALEERAELLLFLGIDPIFDNLRQDQRFKALQNRVGKR